MATDDWQSCVEGADIVVEASRLTEPEPLLKTEWIKPGALVVPYGTMSAVELSLTDIMAKLVVDDWGQCKGGKFGALRAHVEAGKLSEATLHAELGQIVAGLKPGRESDDETILFWHRGLSLSDIALGHAMLEKASGWASASGCASRELTWPLSPMRACIRSLPARRPRGGASSAGSRAKAASSCEIIDHAFPATLDELWSRPDLGCAFICGLPFVLTADPPGPVAAPFPRGAGARAAGLCDASDRERGFSLRDARGYVWGTPRLYG